MLVWDPSKCRGAALLSRCAGRVIVLLEPLSLLLALLSDNETPTNPHGKLRKENQGPLMKKT